MALTSSQAEQVLSRINKGDKLEFDYIKKDLSGKVQSKNLSGCPSIMTGLSSHLMSQMSLTTSGYTTYLKINGKKVIDNGKLVG